MKYYFLGDTHGDVDFLELSLIHAKEERCDTIIQVGDFGFKFPKFDSISYVSTLLSRYNIKMHFCDGNHDDHDWLDRIQRHHDKRLPLEIAPNLIYQPRGSTYVDPDGTSFLFCGGAPSIDKDFRVPGRSWWAQEIISEEQYEFALDACPEDDNEYHYNACCRPCVSFDVLVTHDAPEFPPGYGPKGTEEFRAQGKRSMEMIAGLVEKHSPSHLIHGHWHTNYQGLRVSDFQGLPTKTAVTGVNCNTGRFSESFVIGSKVNGVFTLDK